MGYLRRCCATGAQSSWGSVTVTTGSPWSPGPHTTLSRTSSGVPSRLSLRTWRAKGTTFPVERHEMDMTQGRE